MNKLKLSSRAKVFQKFGYYISIPYPHKKGSVSLDLHKSLKRINKFRINPKIPYDIFNYSVRTKSLQDQACTICQTHENVEMHHRNKLVKIKTDNTLKAITVNLSRRKIPLCKFCYDKVHKGTYKGFGIF